MKKKLQLNDLKVRSFVTESEEQQLRGGAEESSIIISVTLPICPSMYTSTITVCTITICTIGPVDKEIS